MGVVIVAHDRTPPGYAANVCVRLRFLKLPDTARLGIVAVAERMRPQQLGAGDRMLRPPTGLSDGYNGLNPPPVGAVSLASGEAGIRGLSGVGRTGPPRGSPALIARSSPAAR